MSYTITTPGTTGTPFIGGSALVTGSAFSYITEVSEGVWHLYGSDGYAILALTDNDISNGWLIYNIDWGAPATYTITTPFIGGSALLAGSASSYITEVSEGVWHLYGYTGQLVEVLTNYDIATGWRIYNIDWGTTAVYTYIPFIGGSALVTGSAFSYITEVSEGVWHLYGYDGYAILSLTDNDISNGWLIYNIDWGAPSAYTPSQTTTVTGNHISGSGNETLNINHNFADMTTGINTDDNGNVTVIITDASGNTTTITGVENFNFSDQSFTEATLQANDDVRPLFASPQLENGTWVNQYLLPDEFSAPGNPGLEALYDYQYFGDNDGNILVASDDNDFINGFGGDDAINTGAGNDIIDGGLGSNFLTGGTGNDTFFSDGREAGNGAITWSTVTDFTAGTNSVNIWGYIDGTSTYQWYADAGATGWTGATLHADLDGNGTIDTSMTFTGMNISDMSTPQGLEVGGTGYLLIG